VNLYDLEPCTAYTLSAVAVLPSGDTSPASHPTSFFTPSW
jgi:hypothetical protein